MKFQHIIVDTNNLFYRNLHVQKNKHDNQENDITFRDVIEACLISVNKIRRDLLELNGIMYFLFDNFSSKITSRKALYDQYKANREVKPEIHYRYLDLLQILLSNSQERSYCLRMPNVESDDSVKSLIEKIRKSSLGHILVYSEDMDWARGLSFENTHWFAKGEIYTPELFKAKYGFYPDGKKVALYKAIRGDVSDGIPKGVKGLREDALIKILEEFDDVYSLLANYSFLDYVSDTMKKKINENKVQLRINFQLADFLDVDPDILEEHLMKCVRNDKKLMKYCDSFKLGRGLFNLPLANVRNIKDKNSVFSKIVKSR